MKYLGPFLVMALIAVQPALAKSYKWVDEQGIIHLTNDPEIVPENEMEKLEEKKPEPEVKSESDRNPFEEAKEKPEKKKEADWVELPYRERNKTMLVEVMVNGMMEEFLFDTGATNTIISPALESNLELEKIPGSEVILQTANGQVETYMVLLEKVGLGSFTIENVKAAVQDFDRPGSETSGVLGMNVLENYSFSINPKKRIIRLEKPE